MDQQNATISIDTGTIVRAILLVLLFVFLYLIREVVLIILTAVVIASAIEPAARWLVRHGVPRVMSVIAIYLMMMVLVAFIVYFFLPPLLQDVGEIITQAPVLLEAIQQDEIIGMISSDGDLNVSENLTTPELIAEIRGFLGRISGGVFSFLSSVFGGVISFLLIVAMSFYMAIQKDGITHFLRAVTPYKYETYIVDLWGRSQRKIGRWLQGQLTLSLLVGLLTYIALLIIGIPNALFLALVAGVFELVPFLGPILAAIPAVMFALVHGGLSLALITILVYFIIQQVESQLLSPLVIEKVVGVPALLVIISLLIGATLAGFLGVILSVPVAATILEYMSDVGEKKRARHEREKAQQSAGA